MDNLKPVGDATAAFALAGTLTDLLPPIAAAFTIVWMIMCIVINWDKFIEELRIRTNKFRAWWGQ